MKIMKMMKKTIVLLLKRNALSVVVVVPDQPNQLFVFLNGMDVLDDPIFCNNFNSINNKADIRNNVVPNVDNNYGVICDRSDDDNPPPLSPEPPVYTINLLYIHSIIPNNGEISLLF